VNIYIPVQLHAMQETQTRLSTPVLVKLFLRMLDFTFAPVLVLILLLLCLLSWLIRFQIQFIVHFVVQITRKKPNLDAFPPIGSTLDENPQFGNFYFKLKCGQNYFKSKMLKNN
jgi:hypothetical protein